jgi:hypothetical protein
MAPSLPIRPYLRRPAHPARRLKQRCSSILLILSPIRHRSARKRQHHPVHGAVHGARYQRRGEWKAQELRERKEVSGNSEYEDDCGDVGKEECAAICYYWCCFGAECGGYGDGYGALRLEWDSKCERCMVLVLGLYYCDISRARSSKPKNIVYFPICSSARKFDELTISAFTPNPASLFWGS